MELKEPVSTTVFEDLEDMIFDAEVKITQAVIQFTTAIKMGGSHCPHKEMVRAYLADMVSNDFNRAYEEIAVGQMDSPYNKILYRKVD